MSFFKNGETSFYGWVDRVPKIEIYWVIWLYRYITY
jgi:hypothetical protein